MTAKHLTAEYVGSDSVTVRGITHRFPRGGVAPSLARRLISQGEDPETVLVLLRNGKPAFGSHSTLAYWAGMTVEETVYRSARLRRYRPPTMVKKAA